MNVSSAISTHITQLKNNFDAYFEEEMKKLDMMNWICNPFQDHLPTEILTKASEELIDLSEDKSLKTSFNHMQLTKFWLSVADTYYCLFDGAMKVFLPFSTTYLCQVGFSAMDNIRSKYRNELDVSNSLQLKVTEIEVDTKDVMIKNRKQIHPSHLNSTPCI
ncbi:hypothetical protein JTB14_020692 [Gonioctena quinquepunctata]|nr:hypothetical protein JTB14_020692 [Gonioctena quinquepunctata]